MGLENNQEIIDSAKQDFYNTVLWSNFIKQNGLAILVHALDTVLLQIVVLDDTIDTRKKLWRIGMKIVMDANLDEHGYPTEFVLENLNSNLRNRFNSYFEIKNFIS